MNIQPSIMVWTVICFLLLMVILKNLLFDPVLKVIDARHQKMHAAKEKKENNVDYTVREAYPLTDLQTYFGYILRGNNTSNIPFLFKLNEQVDIERLKQATKKNRKLKNEYMHKTEEKKKSKIR